MARHRLTWTGSVFVYDSNEYSIFMNPIRSLRVAEYEHRVSFMASEILYSGSKVLGYRMAKGFTGVIFGGDQ